MIPTLQGERAGRRAIFSSPHADADVHYRKQSWPSAKAYRRWVKAREADYQVHMNEEMDNQPYGTRFRSYSEPEIIYDDDIWTVPYEEDD